VCVSVCECEYGYSQISIQTVCRKAHWKPRWSPEYIGALNHKCLATCNGRLEDDDDDDDDDENNDDVDVVY